MRKLHITLSEESFQAARRCAFDAETTISTMIDYLIEEHLIKRVPDGNSGDTVTAHQDNQFPEVQAPVVPSAWSVTWKPHNR